MLLICKTRFEQAAWSKAGSQHRMETTDSDQPRIDVRNGNENISMEVPQHSAAFNVTEEDDDDDENEDDNSFSSNTILRSITPNVDVLCYAIQK